MPDDQNIGAVRPLRIGDAAPDFIARSTAGPVRLSDYRGKWLLFFSHPGDFTPVCTSEFIAIAREADRFAALRCELLAHSVDSLFSHLAWIRAIHDDLGVTITFPIVEDPSLEIATAFGMVDSDSRSAAAVRATYFIDPDGVVRALTAYPLSVGRSVEEMLRTVAALQRTSDGSAMTPEGWRPGADILAPPHLLTRDALSAKTATHWFYRLAPDGAK
ncbi:peroxiredoxin [Sphingopyxis sp.]|jgi:peroxiredoxin (alkyl hydroperoxide reductase subunit C)|uniref:peroxiredoxin n=1 Tax=Sphingopyxis sp. TaxID=1908224 RepID=UPI0025E44CF3|nr:peroxiredoxin [Sphingopyxis sp.]MBK6413366.1 peroxiredoxin [Sphingopyxis sp.]